MPLVGAARPLQLHRRRHQRHADDGEAEARVHDELEEKRRRVRTVGWSWRWGRRGPAMRTAAGSGVLSAGEGHGQRSWWTIASSLHGPGEGDVEQPTTRRVVGEERRPARPPPRRRTPGPWPPVVAARSRLARGRRGQRRRTRGTHLGRARLHLGRTSAPGRPPPPIPSPCRRRDDLQRRPPARSAVVATDHDAGLRTVDAHRPGRRTPGATTGSRRLATSRIGLGTR